MTLEETLTGLRSAAPITTLPAVELGAGLVDGFAVFPSPLGEVMVAFNPEGVSSVDLAEGDFAARFAARFHRRLVPARPPAAWAGFIPQAIEQGRPGRLPIDLRSVTAFQRSVLEVAATIPRGEVRPYSWLARRVGRPGATRAVGSTMSHNPTPLIVPCHRVVRADGRIGAYSLGGPDRKWALLRREGADPDRLEALAAHGVRYLGSDTTGVFCLPTCRHARRITPGHLVEFRSPGEAREAGFRACAVCTP
jgi:O-6-methylguanine DNA methyltransferase